ncbi:hypothetical protein GSI_12483 [Ganoderma sinense ZZ0214-1]|uniref:Uncharacterized protein n=1 Tax=Ganoderma sinense ZZ0214-1 TaxID=1077348 RepID=A0A2G8RSW1_9APHY|nr:hypothetical protein GSI_12483 [Ganoderma sinense ZZ0214-1]
MGEADAGGCCRCCPSACCWPSLSGVFGSVKFNACRSSGPRTCTAFRRCGAGGCHLGLESLSFLSARADASRRFRKLAMLSVSDRGCKPAGGRSSRTWSRMRRMFVLIKSGSSTASSSSASRIEADCPGPIAPTPWSCAVR